MFRVSCKVMYVLTVEQGNFWLLRVCYTKILDR